MATLNAITVSQLNRLIGLPSCPIIVDICTEEDFAAAPYLVPTALRHDHRDLDGLARRLAGSPSVILCQKGKKLSQGVAAWLRSQGLRSEYLLGGAHAWQQDPHAISLPAARVPSSPLWVTRHRPKIDRIASPWLLRRFVDRNATVLYVAPSEVLDVAARFGATSFDADGADFSHGDEGVTFDSLCEAFALKSPALSRLAQVVRAADLGRHRDCAEAAGLHALSVGLSRQYRDDTAQMEAGLAMYDALYRWARDGQDESHGAELEGCA